MKKMPRKKIAASGGLGALIALLMATTAFKKNGAEAAISKLRGTS